MGVAPILLIFSAVFTIISGSTVNNVRLVGHDTYILSVIEKTMREVEKLGWCNLKVNDVTLDLEEDVMGTTVMGRVEYTNGFVVSIQWLDVINFSVQQVWLFNSAANTSTVEVRGNLRMNSVTLGFDVIANMAEGVERYSATFVHPTLQFDFAVVKDMFLDDLNVRVVGTVPRNTNAPRFFPDTYHSQTIAALYDWNSTTVGIRNWASDIFQPIAYRLIHSEIPFPRICYNCPVT